MRPAGGSKQIGKWGEEAAAHYLVSRGITILERNFHIRQAEIDIIARDGDVLVFVEVKTGRTTSFGQPETWVDQKKQRKIALAAQAYLQIHDIQDVDCRFDVIAIQLKQDGTHIRHIKDAFWLE